jgi:hypothetical protein
VVQSSVEAFTVLLIILTFYIIQQGTTCAP